MSGFPKALNSFLFTQMVNNCIESFLAFFFRPLCLFNHQIFSSIQREELNGYLEFSSRLSANFLSFSQRTARLTVSQISKGLRRTLFFCSYSWNFHHITQQQQNFNQTMHDSRGGCEMITCQTEKL